MYGRPNPSLLFYGKSGMAAFQGQVSVAGEAVDKLAEDRLLNTDVEALVDYFVQLHHVEVPVILADQITVSEHERDIQVYSHWKETVITVPGTAFDFEIPFTGEADVFKLQPNTYDTAPPQGEVRGQTIHFSIAGRDLKQDEIRQTFEQTRAAIERYLGWHRELWAGLDAQVAMAVRARIEQRRARLLTQKSLAAGLADLGVKLKEKSGDPKTYAAPAVKKKIAPTLPPMRPSGPPDPTLDKGQFQDILRLISGAGRSIEQSSSRTRDLGEEALRDMLLVPLNAHFGQATGEAFNYSGKTDILIRHQGGNLFVAECKIWNGDKHYLAAIDQLLGYLTWRDTKAALIVFNRQVGFSAVVAKVSALVRAHASYVSGPVTLDETSAQFTLALPQDRDRHVTLAVLAFDLGPPAAAV
uniref:Uncharacterized protein n=1 Tax=Caulobacter sp. (strain K31) TaxID=366602 RepID=B0T920_CAUSK